MEANIGIQTLEKVSINSQIQISPERRREKERGGLGVEDLMSLPGADGRTDAPIHRDLFNCHIFQLLISIQLTAFVLMNSSYLNA